MRSRGTSEIESIVRANGRGGRGVSGVRGGIGDELKYGKLEGGDENGIWLKPLSRGELGGESSSSSAFDVGGGCIDERAVSRSHSMSSWEMSVLVNENRET